ncbi:hypothetical protein DFH27DRAFT_528800 [Peziza echinospora]|nr:hypothetical protein DFH27DRAFT_528800 [Peziza echinospora]
MRNLRNWEATSMPAEVEAQINQYTDALSGAPRIITFRPTYPARIFGQDPIDTIHKWFNALSPVESISPFQVRDSPGETVYNIAFWDPTFPASILGKFVNNLGPWALEYLDASATLEVDNSVKGTITWFVKPLKKMIPSLAAARVLHDPEFTGLWNLLDGTQIVDMAPNSPARTSIMKMYTGFRQMYPERSYHYPVFTNQAGFWHVNFYDWEMSVAVLYTCTKTGLGDGYMHAFNSFRGKIVVMRVRCAGEDHPPREVARVDTSVPNPNAPRSGWEALMAPDS